MFQPLTVVVMGISAQRLYRGLADFVSAATDMYDVLLSFPSPAFIPIDGSHSDVPISGGNDVSKIKWNHHTVSIPFEVAVNTQQYSMPQTSQYGSYSSTAKDEQSGTKTHELNLENNQESSIGTPVAV